MVCGPARSRGSRPRFEHATGRAVLPGSWVLVLALPWALCMALSWSRGELLLPAPARLVSEVPGRPHTLAPPHSGSAPGDRGHCFPRAAHRTFSIQEHPLCELGLQHLPPWSKLCPLNCSEETSAPGQALVLQGAPAAASWSSPCRPPRCRNALLSTLLPGL